MKAVGLYLHFPFCAQKCAYCDFPSYAGVENRMDDYLVALLKEIKAYKDKETQYMVNTIFMGGGTPTLFDGDALANVLNCCKEVFYIDPLVEVTTECNPGTVDLAKLKLLKNAGVNRLSVGLQAWQDEHLNTLGRIHNHHDFIETMMMAKAAGFENVSADLMYGLPGQTKGEWFDTLIETTRLGVQHISAYGLKIEEGTAFYRLYEQKGLALPDEDDERQMYHDAIRVLKSLSLNQYEISNFSKEDKACRHNLNYWRNGEYIGCGSAAHSHLDGWRFGNHHDIDSYIDLIDKGKSTVAFKEDINQQTEVLETIMLGLRLNEGLCKKDFRQRFGFHIDERYGRVIEELEAEGLLATEDGAVRPTSKGMDFQNRITLAFMI